ncbi:MAG: VOC family protein [Sphingomonadaceae bacterium]|nr:VOC family protein [Sphingomonadaceae bacterium]
MPIAIVSVPVTDQTRARDFYTGVMNFALLREQEMQPGTRWIQLQPKSGGATIALVTWFDSLKPGGQQGLMVHVDDIAAEHARLERAGASPSPIGQEPWGRFTMLEDPDGNGWIVAQLAAPEEIAPR